MNKILVCGNSLEHVNELLKKDIDGVILSIDKLSVNASFYINIDEIAKIDRNSKEIYLSMNKIMHNGDLELVRNTLNKLKTMDVYILFYDMAVYSIAKELDMLDKLVIYQDHLNLSINSNKFYKKLGIKRSFISSDITGEELLDIKKNTGMTIYFHGYGYLPMTYSRRCLITNYLKYINEDMGKKYHIISDMGDKFIICEEDYGTTIYTSKIINLINYLEYLNSIDYIIMNSNNIDSLEFNNIVDKFINKDKMVDCYIGFFNTKTGYKVKE